MRPARIAAAGQTMVPHQMDNPQVFHIENVVLPKLHQRRLVVNVAPLPAHLLLLFGKEFPRFVATVAAPTALRATCEPLARFGQRHFRLPAVAGISDGLALRRNKRQREADINASPSI
jgi:hypothetical protein